MCPQTIDFCIASNAVKLVYVNIIGICKFIIAHFDYLVAHAQRHIKQIDYITFYGNILFITDIKLLFFTKIIKLTLEFQKQCFL